MIQPVSIDSPDFECDVCGKYPDECICPECPICGAHGDLRCYQSSDPTRRSHGLVISDAQRDSRADFEEQLRRQSEMEEEYFNQVEEDQRGKYY